MRSSYKTNNYSDIFFALMEAFRPGVVVELGVLDGYSTIAMAKGMKQNHELKRCGQPHIDAYDLFEKYQYKHSNMETVQKRLKGEGVEEYVTLFQDDAFKCYKKYDDRSIHFLHVDISNTGDILKRVMKLWDRKMIIGGIIAFEGGSEERDNVEWMRKYKKKPIWPELKTNKAINSNYVWGRYMKFPSLTIMLKKWENVWFDIQGNPHTD